MEAPWRLVLPLLTGMLLAAPGVASRAAAEELPPAFSVQYHAPENPRWEVLQEYLRDWAGADSLAAQLSSSLRVTQDVRINFAECGRVSAFYDTRSGEVTICYDMFAALLEIFAREGAADEEVVRSATGALLWILLHETGHALVDLLDLPVTGREEDAVDQFALYQLLRMDGGPEAAVLGVLALLQLSGGAADLGPESFWDEHSLAEQRFANVMCWLFGSDPDRYTQLPTYLIRQHGATEDRLVRCDDEYRQLSSSWATLLRPYTIRTRGGGHTLPAIPGRLPSG